MSGTKGQRGGVRVGAGRPRHSLTTNWLSGHVKERPVGLDVPRGVAVDVPSPAEASAEEAGVWRELAPWATAAGTLRPDTAMAFAWFCRNVVLERKLAQNDKTVAGPDHRGLMLRVEAGLVRFRLMPDGKPVQVAEPKDEWQEFDAPLTVVQGGKG